MFFYAIILSKFITLQFISCCFAVYRFTLHNSIVGNMRITNRKFIKMKSIKFLLAIIFAGLFAITINSCEKCNDEVPRARIINNGTQKASVQIRTSAVNTVNINNIDLCTSSSYSSYAAGKITFTITVKSFDYVKTFYMGKCYDYDIAIDTNNNITATPTDRNN